MTMWEYKFVFLTGVATDDAMKSLNRVGRQGWEMVGTTTNGFMFKRPLEKESKPAPLEDARGYKGMTWCDIPNHLVVLSKGNPADASWTGCSGYTKACKKKCIHNCSKYEAE